ncbi:MAG: hypothetical protein MUF13_05460 [Akkermansiaceae bacterium]|nr:hypothetical protein [Akkermansiaceae bacterium]
MNTLSKIGVGLFALFVAFSMVSQCGRKNSSAQPTLTPEKQAEVILKEYSKGLDLDAVTVLAKKSKDAADFERLLNSKAEAVNNIDLNEDGKVDYINVTEYGSGSRRGFSLTTEISPGKVQEIATIDFQKNGESGVIQTTGNPSLYGPGSYHTSSFSMTDALLMAWLFSNRPVYTSPYGYGNYPPSYGGGWNRQSDGSYSGSMTSRNSGSSVSKSSRPVISDPPLSPNAEKTAAKAKALSSPTISQRSFGSSSSNPSTSSSSSRSFGGFGRSSSSSSSRSGGSFGGGK